MPEIWIPYGDIEVSVDINTENLLGIIKNQNKNIDIETIIEKIKKIKFNQTFMIILGDVSTQTILICIDNSFHLQKHFANILTTMKYLIFTIWWNRMRNC